MKPMLRSIPNAPASAGRQLLRDNELLSAQCSRTGPRFHRVFYLRLIPRIEQTPTASHSKRGCSADAELTHIAMKGPHRAEG